MLTELSAAVKLLSQNRQPIQGGSQPVVEQQSLLVNPPPASWYNVKSYNYDIQAAINAAAASAQGGGVVYIPAGLYLLTAGLTIPANASYAGSLDSAIFLVGEGISNTIIYTNTTNIDLLTVSRSNVGIKDIRFQGSQQGTPGLTGRGIVISDPVDNHVMTSVYMSGCYVTATEREALFVPDGYSHGGSPSDRISIECHFDDCTFDSNLVAGFQLAYLGRWSTLYRFTRCNFTNFKGKALNINACDTVTCRDCLFEASDELDSYVSVVATVVSPQPSALSTAFDHCYFESAFVGAATQWFITIGAFSHGTVVSNCTFRRPGGTTAKGVQVGGGAKSCLVLHPTMVTLGGVATTATVDVSGVGTECTVIGGMAQGAGTTTGAMIVTDSSDFQHPYKAFTVLPGQGLQAVVDAAPGGSQIWLGAGTYYAVIGSPTTPLTIPSTKYGMTIKGQSDVTTFIGSPILIQSGKIRLMDLAVDPGTTAYGIKIYNGGTPFISRCSFERIVVGATSQVYTAGPTNGLVLDGAGVLRATHSTFAFCAGNGVLIDSTGVEPNTTLQFDMCSFVGNGIHGVELLGSCSIAEFRGGNAEQNGRAGAVTSREIKATSMNSLILHGFDFESNNVIDYQLEVTTCNPVEISSCNFVTGLAKAAHAAIFQSCAGVSFFNNRFAGWGAVYIVHIDAGCSTNNAYGNAIDTTLGTGWIRILGTKTSPSYARQATVDFSTGLQTVTTTVADLNISTNLFPMAAMAYVPTGSRDLDELEMDQFEVKVGNIVNNVSYDILTTCLSGDAHGTYFVNVLF